MATKTKAAPKAAAKKAAPKKAKEREVLEQVSARLDGEDIVLSVNDKDFTLSHPAVLKLRADLDATALTFVH